MAKQKTRKFVIEVPEDLVIFRPYERNFTTGRPLDYGWSVRLWCRGSGSGAGPGCMTVPLVPTDQESIDYLNQCRKQSREDRKDALENQARRALDELERMNKEDSK